MVWWVPLAAAGASLIGTAATNEANRGNASANRRFQAEQAQQSMEFSAKEAATNRDFQERMSSTAHQRAADDLEKAGMNRILALSSPASTTSGAQGQGAAGSGSQAHAQPYNFAETGIAAANAMSQIKTQQAQQQLIEAQARNVDANTAGTLSTNEMKSMGSKVPEMINDLLAPSSSGARWFERAREGLTDKLEQIFEGKTPEDYIKNKGTSAKDAIQKRIDAIKEDLKNKTKKPPPIYGGPRIKKISNSQFNKGKN